MLAVRCSVNRYSREFESVQPAYALNQPVNKRGPVNGENGEFEGLREANELKPYG
jgi:hypothetical protein